MTFFEAFVDELEKLGAFGVKAISKAITQIPKSQARSGVGGFFKQKVLPNMSVSRRGSGAGLAKVRANSVVPANNPFMPKTQAVG